MDPSSRHPQIATSSSFGVAQSNGPSAPVSTDDKATASYIRRTLCAHHAVAVGTPPSIHELLPPLTSSNEVDLQLYAIIAVILKEFVQAWYSKITPDHAFIDEVLLVIAHVTRGLEERVRKANLQALLIDEIPQLLEQHILACRTAHQQSDNHHLGPKPATIYHALHPHPALGPVPDYAELETLVEQERNERAWRHMLVQSILAVVLPTEDLQNGSLQSLVEEVIAEMILGNLVSNRICQPWALWELATNILRLSRNSSSVPGTPKSSPARTSQYKAAAGSSSPESNADRLEKFGLLAKSQAADDGKGDTVVHGTSSKHSSSTILNSVWASISAILLLFNSGRWLLTALFATSKYPSRVTPEARIRPIVDMRAWSALSTLIELQARMPWLFGILSLAHAAARPPSGRLADADSTIDRFLSHSIDSTVLNPARVPTILRSLRRTFFPANTFPRGSKAAPDAAAITAIKQECVQTILDNIPLSIRTTYCATSDLGAQAAVVEGWLDVFGDAYMNKHLIFALLELCVVRVLPELAAQGPKVLLAQRFGLDAQI